jgi:hypothetical protein
MLSLLLLLAPLAAAHGHVDKVIADGKEYQGRKSHVRDTCETYTDFVCLIRLECCAQVPEPHPGHRRLASGQPRQRLRLP